MKQVEAVKAFAAARGGMQYIGNREVVFSTDVQRIKDARVNDDDERAKREFDEKLGAL